MLEKIYNRSPIFVQNTFVSVYGAKLYFERYMGEYKRYYRKLLRSQWLSKNDILNNQIYKMKELIKYVLKNVPYYKKIFRPFFRNAHLIDGGVWGESNETKSSCHTKSI